MSQLGPSRPAVGVGSSVNVKTVVAPTNMAGKRVTVFAATSIDCQVRPYVRYHAEALKKCGLTVLLSLSSDRIPNANLRRQAGNADGFLVRSGLASSFQAWSDTFRLVPALWQAETVLLVDDSAFGPLGDLQPWIQKALAASGDLIGMTESYVGHRHFPSYFLMLKRRALRSPQMQAFWLGGFSAPGGKIVASVENEIGLARACQSSALTCTSLFPAPPGSLAANASPLELMDQGCPYLPVTASSDIEPGDWQKRIADPVLLEAIRSEGVGGQPDAEAKADDGATVAPVAVPPAKGKDRRLRPGSPAYATIYQTYFDQALGTKDAAEYVELSETPVRADHCDVKLIAYYLPQFHPIPENDAWWGKGFTEWTNVSKAAPSFAGHYQPRLPGELGFYDLRVPEVMQRQAELATHHGISAFCFHTYWFGGKRLLEAPLLTFLARRDIEIKFCLCWANENWTRTWDGGDRDMLIAQAHSPEDDIAFIRYFRKCFDDPRYLRIDGKPVLTLYRPSLLPDPAATVSRWREEAARMGFPDLFLLATNAFGFTGYERLGFDAISEFPPHANTSIAITASIEFANPRFAGQVFRYGETVARAERLKAGANIWPGVFPAWDNSARRPLAPFVIHGSTPRLYRAWLEGSIARARANPPGERFVVINAWNEWAEGAYLEPDRRFGYAYLAATAAAIAECGMAGHESLSGA